MAKKQEAAKTAAAANETAGASTTVNELPTGEATQLESGQSEGSAGEPMEGASEGSVGRAPAAEAPKSEAKVPISKLRGPRGVPETAKITLVSQVNPKRPGSKAHAAFALYVDQMTVGAFCDAVDALVVGEDSQKGMGTPHLVYDAAHGFIKIEGYEPPGGVVTPKPRAPAKPKAPKGDKAPSKGTVTKFAAEQTPAEKAAASSAAAEAVEAATTEESVE